MDETARHTYEEFLKLSAGEGPDELFGGYVYRGDKLLDIPNQGHITSEEFEKIRAVGWEFIDGEIIKMDAPNTTHQRILRKLLYQIETYLRGKKCETFAAPYDVELGLDDYGDPIRVQPDIVVICDPDKVKDWGCQGAPDLVVEIASPSTRSRDRGKKLKWYRRFGVKEYWMVNPETQDVDVLILGEKDYYVFGCYNRTEKIKVHILDDCEIDLTEVFAE